MTYRYDDLVDGTSVVLVPRYQPPAQQGLDQQLRRSMVLADLGPNSLVIAAIQQLFPRLRSQQDRAALMEALSRDPAQALRQVLRTYNVGAPLRSLIIKAIASQERAEESYGLDRR